MIFKNKHIVIAVIVAPILAILAYLAADYWVSEKPHKLKSGGIYTMLPQSNCRWESGRCTIKNNDISIEIAGEYTANYLKLELIPNVSIKGVNIAFDNAEKPEQMVFNNDHRLWQVSLDRKNENELINLAVAVYDSIFYVQIPTIFMQSKRK